MIDTYAKAYVEILEIIKTMDQQCREKIPSKLIDFFEKNKDSEYTYVWGGMNENSKLSFSQKTIDLLAMIEIKYLVKGKDQELLKDVINENDIKHQKKLKEKYNLEKIFKNNKKKIDSVENSLSVVEFKESVFTKIKKLFKDMFKFK